MTDEETEQRLDEYFEFCDNSSIRPGVQSMALALSVSRQTLNNWENGIGCSARRQDMIIRAKLFVTAYIEQLMLHNKIFPGSGCFFLKNWAGYKDSVIVEEPEVRQQMPVLTAEEIAARRSDRKLPIKPTFDDD